MSTVGSIAISGLSAAALRMQVSANNVANVYSSGPLPDAAAGANFPAAFVPQGVDQAARTDGSVSTTVKPVSPATVPAYDPTAPFANASGLVAMPNVDLGNEAVQQIMASVSYAANAAVLKTDAQMTSTLLNVMA
jgi:flagellar basal-body rod protein FlgC